MKYKYKIKQEQNSLGNVDYTYELSNLFKLMIAYPLSPTHGHSYLIPSKFLTFVNSYFHIQMRPSRAVTIRW